VTALGAKALACLRVAEARHAKGDLPHVRQHDARVLYDAACARWSEKAVCRKFEELVKRRYLECGVSARTGWLTDKGRAALAANTTSTEEAEHGPRGTAEYDQGRP
jgi:hypothetical protein